MRDKREEERARERDEQGERGEYCWLSEKRHARTLKTCFWYAYSPFYGIFRFLFSHTSFMQKLRGRWEESGTRAGQGRITYRPLSLSVGRD